MSNLVDDLVQAVKDLVQSIVNSKFVKREAKFIAHSLENAPEPKPYVRPPEPKPVPGKCEYCGELNGALAKFCKRCDAPIPRLD